MSAISKISNVTLAKMAAPIEVDWFLKSLYHHHLDEQDECYYFMEYTARGGFGASSANQLIFNFKKSLDHQGKPGWGYKDIAISEVAQLFNGALTGVIDFPATTLVPVPPSRCKQNALYDDRQVRLLNRLQQPGLDVRELLYLAADIDSAHDANNRDVGNIMNHLSVDEALTAGMRQRICLFDDVLVTGAHFAACRNVLRQRFPGVPISGIFIARAVQ